MWKNLIPIPVILSVVGLIIFSQLSMTGIKNTSEPSDISAGSITYTGVICIGINQEAEKGTCKKNLFTEYGRNLTRAALGGILVGGFGATPMNATEFIAVSRSNSSQSGTNTSLQGEYGIDIPSNGLGRTAGTIRNITTGCAESTCSGNWTITNTFTATADTQIVNATGLFDSNTGANNNTLFANANFTSVTLNNNDQINITWFIWVT